MRTCRALRVISRKRLLEFAGRHTDAAEPLDNWYRRTKKATWKNLTELRGDYRHADAVGICTVFNIGGNKYRLITKIFYTAQIVLIRFVLTHTEYDKGRWKDDCSC